MITTRRAFVMKLKPGCAQEYRRRHDAIWPEMVDLLRRTGVREYSIFLDEATDTLFAVQTLTAGAQPSSPEVDPVMRRWWTHMADLMLTRPDGAPITRLLTEVFRLE